MAVVALAIVLASWAGLSFGMAVVASHRAKGAADLAALAGASAYAEGADACASAGALARANGAELVACSVHGDRTGFVVVVRVRAAGVTGPLASVPWLTVQSQAGNVGAG